MPSTVTVAAAVAADHGPGDVLGQPHARRRPGLGVLEGAEERTEQLPAAEPGAQHGEHIDKGAQLAKDKLNEIRGDQPPA